MAFDGVRRDGQLVLDIGGVTALGEVAQHVGLARGELVHLGNGVAACFEHLVLAHARRRWLCWGCNSFAWGRRTVGILVMMLRLREEHGDGEDDETCGAQANDREGVGVGAEDDGRRACDGPSDEKSQCARQKATRNLTKYRRFSELDALTHEMCVSRWQEQRPRCDDKKRADNLDVPS